MEDVLRLHPAPSEALAAEDVYGDLAFTGLGAAPLGLPSVAINMVCTLDGRVSVDGKASPIGSRVDRLIMRNIRRAVDAVLVGAGTARAEEMNLTYPRIMPGSARLTASANSPSEWSSRVPESSLCNGSSSALEPNASWSLPVMPPPRRR